MTTKKTRKPKAAESITKSAAESSVVSTADYVPVELANAGPKHRVLNLNICKKYDIPFNEIMAASEGNFKRWAQGMKPYAFKMYMDRLPLPYIDKSLALGSRTASDWARTEGWSKHREAAEQAYHVALVQKKANEMTKMAAVAMEGVSKSIAKYARGSRTMTLPEAEKVSKILVNMDKLTRLASGQPTEIVEQRGDLAKAADMTIKDIIKTLQEDPMTIDVTPGKDDD